MAEDGEYPNSISGIYYDNPPSTAGNPYSNGAQGGDPTGYNGPASLDRFVQDSLDTGTSGAATGSAPTADDYNKDTGLNE